MDRLRLLKRQKKEEHRKREAEKRRKRLEAASPSVDSEPESPAAAQKPVTAAPKNKLPPQHQCKRPALPAPTTAAAPPDGPQDTYFPPSDQFALPKNVGFVAMKSSPSSSVSMSQSPAKMAPAAAKPKKKSYLDDSDSSDEEDILEQARALDRKRAERAKALAADQQQQQKKSAALLAKSKQDNSDETDRKPAAVAKPASRKKVPTFMDDDSDSDDEAILEQSRVLARKRAEKQAGANAHVRAETSLSVSSPEGASPAKAAAAAVETPRDPLARMRARNAAQANALIPLASNQASKKLWSDSEEDEPEDSPISAKKIKGTKKKSESPTKKIKKGVNVGLSHKEREQSQAAVPSIPSNLLADEEEMRHELKPNFATPKFGPFALAEPLKLGGEDGDEGYTVPLSICRYLPEYQIEGIRFLFEKAIATKKGAILGDDMGLGKTVQSIALIAALFGKAGDGTDLLELSRRKKLIDDKASRLRSEQQKALRSGTMYIDKGPVDTVPLDLRMPKWAPVLIVVPNSVIRNWVEDCKTWGHFGVATYHGAGREAALESTESGMAEVLVCAQSMFQSPVGFAKLDGANIKWRLVIVDEFHQFKNHKGRLAENLRAMRESHASVVIGLTGTVMQNNHKELWNLADLAVPGHYGPWKEFEQECVRPIKMARTSDANSEAVAMGAAAGNDVSILLKDIFLRRTKEEKLLEHLPEKQERIIFCEPSPLQKQLYKHILEQPDYILLRHGNAPCDCGVNTKFFLQYKHLRSKEEQIAYQRAHRKEITKRKECCYIIPKLPNCGGIDPGAVVWRSQHKDGLQCDAGTVPLATGDSIHMKTKCPGCIFLPALNILYKVSSHAGLLQVDSAKTPDRFGPGSKEREKAEYHMKRAAQFIPKHLLSQLPGGYVRDSSITDDHFGLSGKMVVLDKLLRSISAQQGRVLLFSLSTQTMDLIGNYLDANGYSFLRMDGQTPLGKRTEIADEFSRNHNHLVFLLSTKACGTGLNLTAANFVIIFDVDWNPANDGQAQDRAYRIGQTENVKVFRLVSRGTVEEMKYLRQVYKQQLQSETIVNVNDGNREKSKRLFRGVEGDSTRKGELFGSENLLKFKEEGSFMDYGHAMKKAESKKFGVETHDTEGLLEGLNEDEADEFADDGEENMFEDLARCTEQAAPVDCVSGDESDGDDHLGGMSQAVMDICENIEVNDDDENAYDNEATEDIPEEKADVRDAQPSKVDVLPGKLDSVSAGLSHDESVVPDVQESSDAVGKKLDVKPLPLSMDDEEKALQSKNETHSHKRSPEKDIFIDFAAVETQSVPLEVPSPNIKLKSNGGTKLPAPETKVAPRNTKLVGNTTNKIRNCGSGVTTFTPFDLPGGSRRKKRKTNLRK